MQADTFRIGPHTPTMKPEDVQLVHRLWLDITQRPGLDRLHHSDIITTALKRFAGEYNSTRKTDILREFRQLEDQRHHTSELGGGRLGLPALPVPDPQVLPPESKEASKNQ
jgi:hypothetical protein